MPTLKKWCTDTPIPLQMLFSFKSFLSLSLQLSRFCLILLCFSLICVCEVFFIIFYYYYYFATYICILVCCVERCCVCHQGQIRFFIFYFLYFLFYFLKQLVLQNLYPCVSVSLAYPSLPPSSFSPSLFLSGSLPLPPPPLHLLPARSFSFYTQNTEKTCLFHYKKLHLQYQLAHCP